MDDVRPDLEALLALPAELLVRLAAAAATAGFDDDLVARSESIAPGLLDQIRLPLVHTWLSKQSGAAATWARLFAYRDAVDASAVREAVGDAATEALTHAGVLVPSGSCLRSRLRLMPFAGVLVGSDEAEARHDPVMGPGATTMELWRALAVAPGETVLDVGCGAGSLALAAAHHGAGEVVGVDLDPRAVAYGRFNARLNGLANATFAAGDLLQPVAGQTYDLVVSQPPFVTQPSSVASTTYLHGGVRGDELALSLLGQLPSVIAPAGRALVLFDTAPPPGQSVAKRVAEALGATPLQVMVVDAEGHSADLQAVGYASATYGELGSEYAAAAAAYREHLGQLEIASSRHVLLEIRHPGQGRRFVASVQPRGAKLYDAAALAELRGALLLASSGPEAMRRAEIAVSPHARLSEERALDGSSERRFRVRFDGGRARDQELSDAAAALLEIVADARDVDTAVQRYAEACGAEVSGVQSAVLEFVRDSLVSGLLVTR